LFADIALSLLMEVAQRIDRCLLDLPLVFEKGRCGPHLVLPPGRTP
jgi:hypothetical protein